MDVDKVAAGGGWCGAQFLYPPRGGWQIYVVGGAFTCNLVLESVNWPTVDGMTRGVKLEVVVIVFMEFGVGLRIYSEEGTHLELVHHGSCADIVSHEARTQPIRNTEGLGEFMKHRRQAFRFSSHPGRFSKPSYPP